MILTLQVGLHLQSDDLFYDKIRHDDKMQEAIRNHYCRDHDYPFVAELSGVRDSDELIQLDIICFKLLRRIIRASNKDEAIIHQSRLFSIETLVKMSCILGDSNAHSSRDLVISALSYRDGSLMKESETLFEDFMMRFSTLQQKCRYITGNNSAVVDLSRNCAVLAYAVETTIRCLPIERTCLFENCITLTREYGFELVNILRVLYEESLPCLAREGNKRVHTKPEVQKLLSIAGQRVLKAFHGLIKVARESQISAIDRDHVRLAGRCGAGDGDSSRSSVSWLADVVPMLTDSCDSFHAGSFIADVLTVYSKDIHAFIDTIASSAEEAAYFSAMLDSCVQRHTEVMRAKMRGSASDLEKANRLSLEQSAAEIAGEGGREEVLRSRVADIKAIFPDYGDGFVIACLRVFDGNADRTIDALLSDNLPPQLAAVDRSLQRAWVGKGGGAVAVAVGAVGRSSEAIYQLAEQSEDLRRKQKERMAAEDRQRELDQMMLAREYDDDYDDQYDDALVYQQPTAFAQALQPWGEGIEGNLPPVTSSSKKVIQNATPINWSVKMAETKRLNSMIISAEAEERFWHEMRNTNRDAPLLHHIPSDAVVENAGQKQGSSVEGKSSGRVAQSVKGSATARQNDDKTTSRARGGKWGGSDSGHGKGKRPEEGVSTDIQCKPKTFDRHHQKDKALRKMGGF